jgi:hypothetical protein
MRHVPDGLRAGQLQAADAIMEPGAFQLAKTYIMEAGGQPAKAISMLTDGYVGESPCCCRCAGCAAASLCHMSAGCSRLVPASGGRPRVGRHVC